MKKCVVLLLFPALISFRPAAQDLNGFWKGTLSMEGCFSENNIELQIKMNGNAGEGDSYHYKDVYNYVKKRFTADYFSDLKKIIVQESTVTTWHIPFHCVICIKRFDLNYSRSGNLETLSGYWTGHILNTNTICPGGSIILTRIAESDFREVPEIKVDTGTLRLDFYDNAEIDGDSITVLVNNKMVLSNQVLGAEPITTYLKVDPDNPYYEVEMIANNLGSIPPNTAVLIVTAGTDTYSLYMAASQSKRAVVRFVYDKNKEAARKLPPF